MSLKINTPIHIGVYMSPSGTNIQAQIMSFYMELHGFYTNCQ